MDVSSLASSLTAQNLSQTQSNLSAELAGQQIKREGQAALQLVNSAPTPAPAGGGPMGAGALFKTLA